jgi:hypothetical protein
LFLISSLPTAAAPVPTFDLILIRLLFFPFFCAWEERGSERGESGERGGWGEREKGSARRKERKRGVSKRVVGGGKPLQTKETTKKGGLDDLSEQSHLFFFVVFS